jgi:hypothetical protein
MTDSQNDDKWCFAWFAGQEKLTDTERAALVKGAKWNPGDVIVISFLDGDPAVQEKVKHYAQQWTAPGLANLRLDFRTGTTDTPVRVSFKQAGSWSTIGTTCRQVTDKTRPTMNFGWINASTPEDEVRRVVLHECGHLLGLIHEHQNPAGGIVWNKPAVIRDLSGPPNNWSPEVIEHNMFDTYDKKETNYTQNDPKSIMHYPIKKDWTLNGYSVGLNTDLSDTDKRFIHQQYP